MPQLKAAEELVALSKHILREARNIKQTPDDGELDQEYKRGAKEAFHEVIEMIHGRTVQLLAEREQKQK